MHGLETHRRIDKQISLVCINLDLIQPITRTFSSAKSNTVGPVDGLETYHKPTSHTILDENAD